MTEKLGYRNSDVVSAVLANRACHILAVYFLLNKKLERYLSGVSGGPRGGEVRAADLPVGGGAWGGTLSPRGVFPVSSRRAGHADPEGQVTVGGWALPPLPPRRASTLWAGPVSPGRGAGRCREDA